MSKTADKKEVLKRLNRIKRNRFFTRMFLCLGASALTIANPDSKEGISAHSRGMDYMGKNMSFDVRFSTLDREKEIDKRVDWFFDAAVDSLYQQYNEITSKKGYQKKKIVDSYFGTVKAAIPETAKKFYCVAATVSNYVKANSGNPDLTGILPDINDKRCNAAVSCPGLWNYMRKKSQKEFGGKYFIESKNLLNEIDSVSKGSIFIVANSDNSSSGLHAITYLGKNEEGKALFMSYNRERIQTLDYWAKNGRVSGCAIDLPGMARAKWQQTTQNCNKMEFFYMMYNNRVNLIEPQPDLTLDKGRDYLGRTFDASSLFVKKAELPVDLHAQKAQDTLLAQKMPNNANKKAKKKFNPVLFAAKNKIVFKRKVSLASRWVKHKKEDIVSKNKQKVIAFLEKPHHSAGMPATFDAAPLFANYHYNTL